MAGIELENVRNYQPLRQSEQVKSIPGGDGYGSVVVDGKPSTAINVAEKQNTTIASALIIVLCVLVGDMARGVLYPTLWLRVSSLGGNKMHQGIAVSAFSMGRIVSSPIFGKLSEIHGYRGVLAACNAIIIMGCLLYSIARSIPILLIAQLIIGFGAGSLGVTRSFVAEHTTKKERTIYMAYLTAVQYGGFTITPIIGAALSAYAYNSPSYTETTFINQYSIAALFQLCSAALAILLLYICFTEAGRTGTVEEKKSNETAAEGTLLKEHTNKTSERVESGQATSNISSVQYSSEGVALSMVDWLAIGGCVLNVTTKGTIGVYETLGVVYSTAHYDWTAMETGSTVTICGIVGVTFLLCFSCLLRCFSDVNLVLFGLIAMSASSLLLSPIFSTPQWMFMTSLISMYAVSYPIGHTALIGIFSKIMKSGPQGKLLGLFGSAGSFARIIFPILAGVLTDRFNDSIIFLVMSIILILSAIIYAYFLKDIQHLIEM